MVIGLASHNPHPALGLLSHIAWTLGSSRLEHLKGRAGPQTLYRLCAALDVSRDQLLRQSQLDPKATPAA
jgi:hypothetical protein